MSKSLQKVQATIAKEWNPVVGIIAHPQVDYLCLQRNGLTFTELLRPYGYLSQLKGGVGGNDTMYGS